MTLGFRTKWQIENMPIHMADKPTYFVEKVWASLIYQTPEINISDYENYTDSFYQRFNLEFSGYKNFFIDPKHHTIREDKKNLWKAGNNIHFVINNRTPNRFQFAPIVKCMSTQRIEIIHSCYINGIGEVIKDFNKKNVVVKIDGCIYCGFGDDMFGFQNEMKFLAINDGFDSVEDFFAWFNKDFTGKIIHWTDLKY